MMKHFFKIAVFLLAAVVFQAFAQDTKIVTARGFGTTVELATQSAITEAVRIAVGSLLDEETVIKNDEIIEEKILSFSNGIVQEYRVIKEPKTNKQGLIELTIKATVKSNLLKSKLEEAKVITGTVENGEEIWRNTMVQIVTDAKRKENAAKVVKKLFDSIRPEPFLTLTYVDRDGNVGENAKLDIVPLPKENAALVSIMVVLGFDREKYFTEMFPYLKQTLDYVCEDKKEIVVSSSSTKRCHVFIGDDNLLHLGGRHKNPKEFMMPSQHNAEIFYPSWRSFGIWSSSGKERQCVINLQTNRRYNPRQKIFTSYLLPEGAFDDDNNRNYKRYRHPIITFKILDKDNEEIMRITSESIERYDSPFFNNTSDELSLLLTEPYKEPCIERIISPNFIMFEGIKQVRYSNNYLWRAQVKIPLNDVKDIAKFEASVEVIDDKR